MAIVGGAKVSTKIEVLTNLVTRMDQLAVGGGMANTFLAAKGIDSDLRPVGDAVPVVVGVDVLVGAEPEVHDRDRSLAVLRHQFWPFGFCTAMSVMPSPL